MNSIIYVGMDVHKASFTLSCFSVTTQETFATVKISPDAKAIRPSNQSRKTKVHTE